MITYIIIKMHIKRRVQNRIYKASVQRVHGAPTMRLRRSRRHHSFAITSPQRAV